MREGELVAYLGDEERARLLAVMDATAAAAGEAILHKGSPARSLLLIEEGEVDIVDAAGGEGVVLATLGPGSVFGEVGFVDGLPRTHDVWARTDCRLRRLTRDSLLALAQEDAPLFAKVVIGLAELLAARFRDAVRELEPLRAFAATLEEPMEDVSFDEVEEELPESAMEMLRELARSGGKDAAGI
jgi:CRP-like cAMP-binding protein